MKKLMFLVAASLFVFAACSSEDDSSPEVNPENAAITFELSAVNGLTDGIGTRMPVYSQEATQHVTRVSVYAFVQNGSTYLHQKDRKSTRLNSSHMPKSRMPSSA